MLDTNTECLNVEPLFINNYGSKTDKEEDNLDENEENDKDRSKNIDQVTLKRTKPDTSGNFNNLSAIGDSKCSSGEEEIIENPQNLDTEA